MGVATSIDLKLPFKAAAGISRDLKKSISPSFISKFEALCRGLPQRLRSSPDPAIPQSSPPSIYKVLNYLTEPLYKLNNISFYRRPSLLKTSDFPQSQKREIGWT